MNGEQGLTLMSLVHELKEFVDDSLEELPMRFEEARVLANNIHDVGGYDSFVVFATFNLAKTKQVFDNSDQEALLCLLV